MNRTVNRKIKGTAWGLSLGPLLLLALLMGAALHLRVRLGHWAVPMVDDYDGHHLVFIWLIVLAVVPGIPFWMMILFSSLKEFSLGQRIFLVATYLTCWSLFGLYCRTDPWRYIEWYMD